MYWKVPPLRPGTAPPPGPGTPPGTGPGTHPNYMHAGRYGQQAGGTHPTGMRSRSSVNFNAASDSILEIKEFLVYLSFLGGGTVFYICHTTYTHDRLYMLHSASAEVRLKPNISMDIIILTFPTTTVFNRFKSHNQTTQNIVPGFYSIMCIHGYTY